MGERARDERESIMPVKIGLSRSEAAAHIGISDPTFDRLVEVGSMPKPIRIFSRLVWDRRAIEAAFARLGADVTQAADENEWV